MKNEIHAPLFSRIALVFLLCVMMSVTLLMAGSSSGATEQRITRTRAEIDALIEEVGRTKPDWWDSAEMIYPETLELDWPMKAEGDWNSRKNVGQFIWDIINPNPGRWHGGIRLVHHILTLNKDEPAKVTRDMQTLGGMYHNLLEDWPRAVFWWRKSGGNTFGLAHCYWELGNKDMAVKILKRLGGDYTRHGSIIKLWADMGEFDKAIKLAEAKARTGMPDTAYLAAAEACRFEGKYKRAIAYYEKVLATPDRERKGDIEYNKKRASASIEAIKLFHMLDLERVPDGVYQSDSFGYNGQVYVEVQVKDSQIESVKVTQHREKQFYSAITDTIKQIMKRQSVKGIDTTTGATITSEAIINAAAKALASGME